MLNVTINHQQISVEEGTTILDAARQLGIRIPTLCHLNLHDTKMVNQVATCRVCMVEVEGRRNLLPACNTYITEGMVVNTHSKHAVQSRRIVLELLLSNHPRECLICARNQNCELQTLAGELGIREVRYRGYRSKYESDTSSYSFVRDPEKCILCRRCETMCNEVQKVGVYSAVGRGFETVIGTAQGAPMLDTVCTFCGQCVSVCPTGALTQVDKTPEVWMAINDHEKYVIVQTAPAIRAALGEEFGMPVGTPVTGKMVTALRKIGFDKVLDTDFAADLTIMEEAHELIERIKNNGKLPMLTSCCPAWIKFIEHQFPELLDVPSTCKSPQEMLGAVAKTYYAQKLGIDPKNLVVVSVMPCLAKKYEVARSEFLFDNEVPYVDYSISTRELARMIKEAGVNFADLPDEDFDSIMGESSGAGVIFGATGGVIEAAVRTAYVWLTGEKPQDIEFTQLRGMDGIREGSIQIGDMSLKIGIAHGLGNARTLLEMIRDGKADYHAIEIMACPGGCVGGGGQPHHGNNIDVIEQRAKALYAEDRGKQIRYSHENEEIKKLYEEFLEKPGSHKAHELLHTSYTKRSAY